MSEQNSAGHMHFKKHQAESGGEASGDWLEDVVDQATLERWCKFSYWTVEEAVALSYCKDPKAFNWERLKPFKTSSKFVEDFEFRLERTQRAVDFGYLQTRNDPARFLIWAINSDFPIDDCLAGLDFVRSLSREQDRLLTEYYRTTTRSRFDDFPDPEPAAVKSAQYNDLGERERSSMLKLIIMMAIAGYGYDPKASRTTTAKEIAGDMAKRGLPMDEDTVRRYLRLGTELLPAGWDMSPVAELPKK